MKSKLKAPGTERLTLTHDNLLSIFAFKFILRRCRVGGIPAHSQRLHVLLRPVQHHSDRRGHHLPRGKAVQLDPIKPTLKAPGINRLRL